MNQKCSIDSHGRAWCDTSSDGACAAAVLHRSGARLGLCILIRGEVRLNNPLYRVEDDGMELNAMRS